jgi:hypothetical protein
MKPNLFNYATSELSQDAFLCWILSWADIQYKDVSPNLHSIGQNLLKTFFKRAGKKIPNPCEKVVVRKQVHSIDILCEVDNCYSVIIEDKVGTKDHSDQLARYKKSIVNKYSDENTAFVYLQTGDQGDRFKKVEKEKYIVFNRADLLGILESTDGLEAIKNNDIYHDYVSRLRKIEDDVQSFELTTTCSWSRNSSKWKGFYLKLQEHLEGEWAYIPNPNGGFHGYWCYSHGNDNFKQYLQIEEDTFCVKIKVADKTKRSSLRNLWSEKIIAAFESSEINAIKPKHFGVGTYMTIAVLGDCRVANQDGLIDIDKTVELIKQVDFVISEAAA